MKYLFLFLLLMPVALAEIDFDQELSNDEVAQLDAILDPVLKVYNFVKYSASVIGVLMLVFSGITFVTANGEMAKKEKAKSIAAGVVIGLIIIWVAPLVVKYIFS